MRVVAALALTLAMAPAPEPSPSPTVPGGLLGGLVGGLGSLVDGLLGAGDDGEPSVPPSSPPSDAPSAAPTTPGPSATSVPTPGSLAPSVAVPSGVSTNAPGGVPGRVVRPGGGREPSVVVTVVPQPAGAPDLTPSTSDRLAVPTVVRTDPVLQWAALLFAVGVLALPVVLLVRRRPAPAAPAPAPVAAPGGPVPPGPEDTAENVTRLPTNLNAIYELGRLDERLAQERERRS
ncbi:hypothetical protein [Micromonospora avicenniae]|uniref:MYXO-CTERM domain-containing protein n=1 Tax=Micromonospora avicenniae TaxID=1198245 RepID=A0A1N7FDJ9_9ACTN|nr:hypothetical protein [Micromonospora avicenniae]SIR98360.1 hypothetical protein SAMN05444858_13415 [Micromonospora avicenniae]